MTYIILYVIMYIIISVAVCGKVYDREKRFKCRIFKKSAKSGIR